MSDARQLTPVRAKYRVLMELGRGGMGVVHLAMTRGPQGFVKLVVLKMLLPELIGSEAARRMFLEEARISARLAHPNVVQVYEVIEYDGVPTMVMEYLEGRPLSTVIGDEPTRLPLRMHLHVLGDVLAGLHAAHELRDYDGTPLQLIHRDISPHNVFLLFEGRVKVLDFGIAKAARSGIETHTGELKGKLRYMAPEQLRGQRDIDRRADLFSVGVMLWEALAGRRMWAGLTDADVMLRLLNSQVPPLPPEAKVPAKLAAVCMKALATAADQRYATAADFARELEEGSGDLSHSGRSTDLSAYMMQRFGEAHDSTHRLIDAHIKAAEQGLLDERPADEQPTAIGTIHQRSRTRRKARSITWQRAIGAAGGLAVLALAIGAWALHGHASGGGPGAPSPSASSAGGAPPAGSTTPVSCQPGFKACGGQCVSIDRPDVGCGSDDCEPCEVANATPRCNARHSCDIAVCFQDHDNCDGDPKNGCETEVRVDPNNCGGCNRKCASLPHARTGCGDVCTIWRCDDGYRDCNGAVADGCETRTSDDPKNCGHCGVTCSRGQHCRAGRCIL